MKELIMTIRVLCEPPYDVQGQECKVVMISFRGEASGEYFTGETIGTGVDTQRFWEGGKMQLSARYMLAGQDSSGEKCKVFIENCLRGPEGWVPTIVTDSKVLAKWENTPLAATVDGAEGGVIVKIYER